MKLITELNEQVSFLKENKTGKPEYFLEGIFIQAEKKNKNGRVYPIEILQKEVAKYKDELVSKKRAFGELGHPDGPTINLDRVSHMIVEIEQDGNNFIGSAKILDTPNGKIVKALIDEGATLGVSTRGMGSLKSRGEFQEVQDDFSLATAADIVADPSAPDAFVNGIMEGVEWVWHNGVLKASAIENYRDIIEEKSSSRELTQEAKLSLFEDFLKKLSK
tara:strand:+ start:30399 stop:31055 length:657 start_codon:yes stop_codon:yes gene_type:complete